jgi:hypothetical protein
MLDTLIADANVAIPKAVDEALRATGARLLGELLEVPEAWAGGQQAMKHAAEFRSLMAHALADASAKDLLRNPDIVAAFGSALADDIERKLHNRATVFRKTVDLLGDGTLPSDDYAAAPGDDWLNAFQRISEDASSDKMQDLLSRILAGEINRSGSYSIATARKISEMDAYTAECFAEINAESFDKIHVYRSDKYADFPWWDRINTLRDAGLISASDGAIHNPSVHLGAPDGIGYWSIGAEPAVMIKFRKQGRSEIPVFKLTKMGMEISTLFPAPDFERNLRFMVEDNPYKDGWIEAHVLVSGQIGELLYAE